MERQGLLDLQFFQQQRGHQAAVRVAVYVPSRRRLAVLWRRVDDRFARLRWHACCAAAGATGRI